uniref:Uncharacterized protein n=2 Tax=Oryza TaxID=4527 RepID=A0A0E0GA72_ORYNI
MRECNNRFNPEGFVVALSGGGSMTTVYIQIYNNDNIVAALVIDECDSRNGCNLGTGYLLPCSPNTIAASPGV